MYDFYDWLPKQITKSQNNFKPLTIFISLSFCHITNVLPYIQPYKHTHNMDGIVAKLSQNSIDIYRPHLHSISNLFNWKNLMEIYSIRYCVVCLCFFFSDYLHIEFFIGFQYDSMVIFDFGFVLIFRFSFFFSIFVSMKIKCQKINEEITNIIRQQFKDYTF